VTPFFLSASATCVVDKTSPLVPHPSGTNRFCECTCVCVLYVCMCCEGVHVHNVCMHVHMLVCVYVYVCMSSLWFLKLLGLLCHVVSASLVRCPHLGVIFTSMTSLHLHADGTGLAHRLRHVSIPYSRPSFRSIIFFMVFSSCM